MTRSERLRAVFHSALGDLQALSDGELRRELCPEWDSLRHVRLILGIQREFGVRFSATEILSLDSFSAILENISRKLPQVI